MIRWFWKFSENHRYCDVGKPQGFSVTLSAVHLGHLSDCDAVVVYFEIQIFNFVALTHNPAVFSRSILRALSHTLSKRWFVRLSFTYSRKMIIISSGVQCYIIKSLDVRGTGKQRRGTRLKGSNVVLLVRIILYFVGMWYVNKETR
jgi:hypothetical protein